MPILKSGSGGAEKSSDSNQSQSKPTGGVGKDESAQVPTVPEVSAKPELTPEERWKQFDEIMAKLSGELTLLSQEAAFQTLLVCSNLKQEEFDEYLETLLTEQVSEAKAEVNASPSSGFMAGFSNAISSGVGAITRRLSSTGPTKSDLKQSLKSLYEFLMELKLTAIQPDFVAADYDVLKELKKERLFNQFRSNVVLEGIKLLKADPKLFSVECVLPQLESKREEVVKGIEAKVSGEAGDYLVSKVEQLKQLLRTHSVGVRDVVKLHSYFSEENISTDPIEALQILLGKTRYSGEKLARYRKALPQLLAHCDALGEFFSPDVISLKALKKHILVPAKCDAWKLYLRQIKKLVFEKGFSLKDILSLNEKDFSYIAQCDLYFTDISHEKSGETFKHNRQVRHANRGLLRYLCGLKEAVRDILSSQSLAVLSLMKRRKKSLVELVAMEDFQQSVKGEKEEIRWPTLLKKSTELLAHPVFESSERVCILIALVRTAASKKSQDKTNDTCFEALLDQFKAKKVAIIEKEIKQAKEKRGGLWVASLRKDPLDEQKQEQIRTLDLNIQAFNLILSEIFRIFEQSDDKACEGMSAYLQVRCVKFAKNSKLDKSILEDDLDVFPGLKEDFSSFLEQAELFPNVVLAQDEEFLFFIRETPLSLQTLISFLERLSEDSPILANVRLLQTIHETMGYTYEKLIANPDVTTYLANHFEALSPWLKSENITVEQLASFLGAFNETSPLRINLCVLPKIQQEMGYSFDELVANPEITTFIVDHFEVLSGWLKSENLPLGSLVNLLAQESIAEVTDEELQNLSTLYESPILPFSVVLSQSASYIRMIASKQFVKAVNDIWKDFSNSIPRVNNNFREEEREKWIERKLNEIRQYDPVSGGAIQSEELTLLTIPKGVFSLVQDEHINVRQLLSLTKEQAGFLGGYKETIIALSQSVGKTVFDMMCSYESLVYVVAVLKNNQADAPGTKQSAVRWCLEPSQQFLLPYLYPNFSLDDRDPFFQEKLPWIQENRDKLEGFLGAAYQGVQIAQFFDHTPSMRDLFLEHPPVDRGESGVRDSNYANFCRALWDKGSVGSRETVILQEPFSLSEGKHWVYREPQLILDLMKRGVSWESIEAISDSSLAWIWRAIPKSNTLAAQLRKEKDLNDPKAIAILEGLMDSLIGAFESGEKKVKSLEEEVESVEDNVKAVLRANRACRRKFRAHPVRWGVLSGGMAALAVLTPLVSSWLLPTFVLSTDALSALPSGLLLGLGITVAVLAVAAAVYAAKKTHDHRCRSALFQSSPSMYRDSLEGSFEQDLS